MMQEDVRLLFTSFRSAVDVFMHVHAYMCVCVCTCIAMWAVGVCGWYFVLNGHLYSSFKHAAAMAWDRCARLSLCVSVCTSETCGSAVGDSTVFMCDSYNVSEEEVSYKCSSVPDRTADRSANSLSFHSDCVFSEWVVSSVCSFTAGGGEILQKRKKNRSVFFFTSCLVLLLCHWADF